MAARGRGGGHPLTASTRTCLGVAALAAALALAWQCLTIRYNREGNWTALYCTGSAIPVPAALEHEGVYLFPGTGFDGQFYHYIAHDPLLRHGLARSVDDPRLRYRRILVPALAFAFALGRSAAVDGAYLAVIALTTLGGAFALARYALDHGRHVAWGLAFLAVPATIVSIDRLVGDVALAALCVAFASRSASGSRGRLYGVLVAAPLVRETGLLLVAAAGLSALARRELKRSAWLATAALPCALWWAFVASRTTPQEYPLSFVPLSGVLSGLLHPASYADKAHIVALLDRMTDRLALAGVLLAFVLAFLWIRRRPLEPVHYAALLFAALGTFIQRDDHWGHVFDFARVYSPLLVFLGLDSLRSRSLIGFAPTLLMCPRIAMQLVSQVAGVLDGLVHALR